MKKREHKDKGERKSKIKERRKKENREVEQKK